MRIIVGENCAPLSPRSSGASNSSADMHLWSSGGSHSHNTQGLLLDDVEEESSLTLTNNSDLKHGEHCENIPMTVPVSTEFTVRSATDKVYEMCFYLGQEHQDDPPSPLPNAEVHILERPEMHVLTRTVGGYKTHEEDWMEEAGLLAAVLEEDGISVDLSHMYWVGYDAPMKFWNRRNEIWYKIN